MPNWCENTLRVVGDAAELKRFIDANMGYPAQYPPIVLDNGTCVSEPQTYTEKHFCFNALIPTPQEVLDIGFDGQGKIPKEEYDKLIFGGKTDKIDGYHWNCLNWGTKWDIYYDDITYEELCWREGCENIDFTFDTAWSPPIPWLIKNIETFPQLVFYFHYEEPGCYFAGDIYGEGGTYSHNEYDNIRCAETFNWLEEE